MRARIAELKAEQKKIREENQKCARDIRNAERRSRRLRTRVMGLTDRDLNEVILARAEKAAIDLKRKSEAKASPGRPKRLSRSPAAQETLKQSQSVSEDLPEGPGVSAGKAAKKTETGGREAVE